MPDFALLTAGDPAPLFHLPSPTTPRFTFGSVAGRYLVLAFFHDGTAPQAVAAQAALLSRPDLFDDDFASFFGISSHPDDVVRLLNRPPGYRYLFDTARDVGRLYGAVASQGEDSRGMWVVIDPTFRVINAFAFEDMPDGGAARVVSLLETLPPPVRFSGQELQAPILYLPRVFEPDLCRRLIAHYDAQGGEMSGVMRQIGGRTTLVHDPAHKVRRDVLLSEPEMLATIQSRILHKIVPEIAKVHQFRVTRMERYLVACYDSADGAHFRPHRDNTTAGTAHRRFAVSINLNDDFDGGEVSFPEYGPRGFKAAPGGAVVFSCSLLHAVSEVTRGARYAFLPFLYDEAAARLREHNRRHETAGAEPATPSEPAA